MKRSKAYRQAAEQIEPARLYGPAEAVSLAKKTTVTKFDPTVEVALRLGVDPRRADQMVRGTVNLPHGTGKTARVLVFATGARAEEATAAGADYVGTDDLIERIQGGFLDFDAVVATPDMMGKVGRLARGPGRPGHHPRPDRRPRARRGRLRRARFPAASAHAATAARSNGISDRPE